MAVLPDLDAPCGDGFSYRDLIECGDTWHRLAAMARATGSPVITNRPDAPATYQAIEELCARILGPVRRHFGSLTLTYGFASQALVRQIPARIAPVLDQHAGHEITAPGVPRCDRLGLAVDFRVDGADTLVVAAWLAEHCAFDRLYVYGRDRALHASVAPRDARPPVGQIVRMEASASGRLLPRRVSLADLRRAAASRE
jgi:hypothetical protein